MTGRQCADPAQVLGEDDIGRDLSERSRVECVEIFACGQLLAQSPRVIPPLLSRHRGRLWQVAVALDDGQARVLRVAGVRSGERAPEANRVAAGRPQYSMAAAATEPNALPNTEKPIRHSLNMHGRTVV